MATPIETVFCFGDSNVAGCGATGRRGWAQQLSDLYYSLNEDNPKVRQRTWFLNLAFPGATTETFRDQLVNGEGAIRYLERKPTLSILSIGAQDISVSFKDGRGPQEREVYAKYMAAAVGELLTMGDILYVGIPAPNMPLMERLATQRGYAGSVRDVVLDYEATSAEIVASMAAERGRRYGIVPLFSLTELDPAYSISEDNIHPDTAGHTLIRELVEPVFRDMVELGQ